MQALAGVHYIDDVVGFELAHTVADAGQIGGGVEEAAALFLDDEGGGIAFFVFEFIEEDYFGTAVVYG